MLRRDSMAAVLAVVMLCGAAIGDEPATGRMGEVVQKRYHWQAGMTTYKRSVTTSDMTIGEGAEARPSHDVMAMLTREEVYSVKDDGTGRVAMTIVRVRTEKDKGGTKERVFDSAEPEKATDELGKKTWASVVGRTIITEITPEGRVIRQDGTSEMFDAMMGAMDDPKEDAAMREKFAKMREGMKEVFKMSLAQMAPGMPVMGGKDLGSDRRVGEVWTSEKEGGVPMLGNMKWRVTNKIVSLEKVDGRRIVTTTSKGTQDSETEKGKGDMTEVMGMMGIPMKMDMRGDSNSIDVFDLDRGRLVRSESMRKASGTLTVTLPDLDGKGASKEETKKYSATTRTVTELVGPEDPIVPGAK